METTTKALLQQLPIFAGMPDNLLQILVDRCRRRKFRAGEAIFHEGDPGYTVYVIVAGTVNIQTMSHSGEVVHQASRGPGEHFGELSLIDGKPRMADAVTASSAELISLHRDDFLQCVQQSPQIALNVMASLADRLRQAAQHLESQTELDVLGRVSCTVLELMAVHGKPHPAGGTLIEMKIPQQALAEQIGTTRESVNRAFASLKEVGAIRYEGRQLVVVSEKKLRQRCGK